MAASNQDDLLGQLAARVGIAPDYHDIWGRLHRTSPETAAGILAAMGLAPSPDGSWHAALDALDRDDWAHPCDPVLVRRTDRPPGVWSFRMSIDGGQEFDLIITWELVDEAGRVQQKGQAGPGMDPAERREADGVRMVRVEVPVPDGLPLGYFTLRAQGHLAGRTVEGLSSLIVVPPRCYLPPEYLAGRRTWGLAVQLYALRSRKNWGVGDLGDLADLIERAGGEWEAGLVGLNPLHALRNERPYHISPYSPDSRLFLNPLYLDVPAVPEVRESEAAGRLVRDPVFVERLARLRAAEFVDYDGVWAAKQDVLDQAFETILARHVALSHEDGSVRALSPRGEAFCRFVQQGGELLERFGVFQALAEEFRRRTPPLMTWQEWPEPYRCPDSADVAAFRVAHARRVVFTQYLQWVLHEQLAGVVERAAAVGMPIGLYHDLALGSDRAGCDAWMIQQELALEAESGCPPDAFAPNGQNWGFPPLNPLRLRAQGYRFFSALLRANMRYGGALRIDHVMGLFRLFWIPRGMAASAGAYVAYPFEDLLGILALESVRHRAMIVGEDLGTVPDWVRARLAEAGVLSYRVLYFERDGEGAWKPPAAYPAQSVGVVTTHDLPTLAGYWMGEDVKVRGALGLLRDAGGMEQALRDRNAERSRVIEALRLEGLQPDRCAAPGGVPACAVSDDLVCAVHAYLARTPSWLVMATLDDLLGETVQANVPGTVEECPNWSRKARIPMESLGGYPRVGAVVAALKRLRPREPARNRAPACDEGQVR